MKRTKKDIFIEINVNCAIKSQLILYNLNLVTGLFNIHHHVDLNQINAAWTSIVAMDL